MLDSERGPKGYSNIEKGVSVQHGVMTLRPILGILAILVFWGRIPYMRPIQINLDQPLLLEVVYIGHLLLFVLDSR